MAYSPTQYTDGSETRTAWTTSEASQLEWEGWWKTGAPSPYPTLPSDLPAHLDLDNLKSLFVEKKDIHVGATEPAVKRVGMLWFRPI